MGCLFAQREKIVLHASAIEKEGKSFIFAGDPGIGKSTLLLQASDKSASAGATKLSVQSAALIALRCWPDPPCGVQ